VAPEADVYVPAVHEEHAVAAAREYFPLGQLMHVEEAVAPALVE